MLKCVCVRISDVPGVAYVPCVCVSGREKEEEKRMEIDVVGARRELFDVACLCIF